MKIESIRLHNFRPFYGTTPKLEFSSGAKSVTVIHASNGGGKTAILNAFTWALYEAFTPGFLLKEHLVNKRALREASPGEKVTAWVEVEFEHEGSRYSIKRIVYAIPTTDMPFPESSKSEVEITRAGNDGVMRPVSNPATAIGRILPEPLHRYFFFDGERIEKIVSPDKKAQEELERATKMFLGVEVLVRAERHLTQTRKDFEDTLKSIGDAETSALIAEKKAKESEIQQFDERLEELGRNAAEEEKRQALLEATLRDMEAAASLQARREQLRRDLDARRRSQEQNISMLKSEVSTKGYATFLDAASDKFMTLLESLQKRGELPAGIKINFVNELLEKELCICGTSLSPQNEEARSCVERWRSRAGLVEVEDKAIRMKGEVSQIRSEMGAFWQRLDEIQLKRHSDAQEISRIEDELDEISDKFRGSSLQEVAELEERLAESRELIRAWEREETLTIHKSDQLKREIDVLDVKIQKHESKEARQRLIQRRIAATIESVAVIKEIRLRLESAMRRSLQQRIRRLFSQLSITPYQPDLTGGYTLRLLESAGGSPAPVAASQGESQLLSFSFIGAIVEEAKEWSKKQTAIPGPNKSEYPIVMDSPFGNLDPTYRSSVAGHLNILADQAILLLTKTQWRGEVETAVSQKVASHYVVTYFSPREDLSEDLIQIGGEDFQVVAKSSNDFEYSTIQKA